MSEEPWKYKCESETSEDTESALYPWLDDERFDAFLERLIERRREEFYEEWSEYLRRDYEPDRSIQPFDIIR